MDLSVITDVIAQSSGGGSSSKGLQSIALGVGAGLGTIGPGVGVGYIPLPVNSHETIDIFGIAFPAFSLYAATANLSIPLVLTLTVFVLYQVEGIRKHGLVKYLKGWLPAGVSGPAAVPIFFIEVISQFMRIISLSVRLFANILAGHLLILFMGGGLAVLLGLTVLGWITLPIAIAFFCLEVGLIATLQAFIFATLTSIYFGEATAGGH